MALRCLSTPLWLVCWCLVVRLGSAQDCPPGWVMPPGCDCATSTALFCTGVPVLQTCRNFTDLGIASSIHQLSFAKSPDTVLLAGSFSSGNFTSLDTLQITLGSLVSIEKGAFSGVPNDLQVLDLQFNKLKWVNRDSFEGLGGELERLRLSHNELQFLNEDLQPFFSTIMTEIGLNNNNFTCDCHLVWLQDFAQMHTQVTGATCADQGGMLIANSSVDFASCRDLCKSGLHPCEPNANCSLVEDGRQTTCICQFGYYWTGTDCESLCQEDSYWNGTDCESLCQEDSYWNGTDCESLCQEDSYWNGTGCKSLCQEDSYWNGTDCESLCQEDSYWNGTDCESLCQEDSYWNGTDCESLCQEDSYWNGTDCESLCQEDSYWNGTDCESLCQEDSYWNGTGCQYLCQAGLSVWNGTDCVLETTAVCPMPCEAHTSVCFQERGYCVCAEGHVYASSGCIALTGDASVCEENLQEGFLWPATLVQTTVVLPCLDQDGKAATANRTCNTGEIWGEVLAPQCISLALEQLWNMFLEEGQGDLSALAEQLHQAAEYSVMTPQDILAITNLLAGIVERGPDPEAYQDLVDVASELLELEKQALWNDLEDPLGTLQSLLGVMDDLGIAILRNTNTTVEISTENVVIIVVPDDEWTGDIIISSESLNQTGGEGEQAPPPSTLYISQEVLEELREQCPDLGIVAVMYEGAGPLLQDSFSVNYTEEEPPLANGMCMWYEADPVNSSTLQVNSVIISVVVVSEDLNCSVDTSNLSIPIIITLQHDNTSFQQPVCAFLNEMVVDVADSVSEEDWVTEGCYQVNSTDTTTVCACDHLTSFAILMSPTGDTSTNQVLHIVSIVGLCVSILCLIPTILLLFILKLETKLCTLHRQLALALCLSQLLFLIGVDRGQVPSPDAVCTTIAALLHYFLLCTFCWQLLEGVHLYIYIIQVFFNERVYYVYPFVGWGLPLVIVAITLGVSFCDYGSENYCWISTGHGTNWAFHGPVIGVLLVNAVVLVMVLCVIVKKWKSHKHRNVICLVFQACLFLFPLLGMTWIFGFFVFEDSIYSTVLEYVFCVASAFQGIALFLLHCIFNKEVRVSFLKAIGCRSLAHKHQRDSLAFTNMTSGGPRKVTEVAKEAILNGSDQQSAIALLDTSQGGVVNKLAYEMEREEGDRAPLALELDMYADSQHTKPVGDSN